MADDKKKRGGADRRRVAGGEGYEVNYFANKHGITREQARNLISKVGNDRTKLNRAAEGVKTRSTAKKTGSGKSGSRKTGGTGPRKK